MKTITSGLSESIMTTVTEKNMSRIAETGITPFVDCAYEANTTAALALRLSEQDQFVNLASQVEDLLNRANKFIEAANLLERANGTNGNELNGMAGEISLARNQGQQLVEDALTLLSDPELMTEPDMALKRAELIYLGAKVSSGLHTNYSSRFFALMPVSITASGSSLLSRSEFNLVSQQVAEEKAQQELEKALKLYKEKWLSGGGSILLFKVLHAPHFSKCDSRVQAVLIKDPPRLNLIPHILGAILSPFGHKYDRYSHITQCANVSEFPVSQLLDWKKLVVQSLIELGYKLEYRIKYEFETGYYEELYLVV
jgi:hypothetical protein